jgi:restriction system protein
VVRSLTRAPVGAQLVPAGETPWLWLGGAALWLLLWPAAIALKMNGHPLLAWLPWWLPLLAALLHLFALAIPVWLSERAASRDELRRRFGKVRTIAEMLALEPEEFEVWSGMLFQLMGFQVRNTRHVADHGIDLEVSNDRIRYGLVQCKRYRGTVGEPVVRDLYGTMVHERADYGWLVTTGGISRQAYEWAMGKPMDLWDGQKLVELARRYR